MNRQIIKIATTQVSAIAHPKKVSKNLTTLKKESMMQHNMDRPDTKVATDAIALDLSLSIVTTSILQKSI